MAINQTNAHAQGMHGHLSVQNLLAGFARGIRVCASRHFQFRIPALSTPVFQSETYTGYALFSLSAAVGSIFVCCACLYLKKSVATCGNSA